MSHAFVAVDVQNDFCEGGALPVTGGHAVANNIKEHLAHRKGEYDLFVATMDWHKKPGKHWEEWPRHCEAGTPGAQLHPDVALFPWSYVVKKGERSGAESGFEGFHEDGRDLSHVLADNGIERLTVGGLALDVCVLATVKDAIERCYEVRLLLYLTAPVTDEGGRAALEEMEKLGVAVEGGIG